MDHTMLDNHLELEEITMITCNDCGRLNEGKELGKSWICEDCKEGNSEIKDSPIQPIEPIGD